MSLNWENGGENKNMTELTEHQRYERWSNTKHEIERYIYLDLVKNWHKKSNHVGKEQYEELNGNTQVIQIWNMDEKDYYRTNYIVHLRYFCDGSYGDRYDEDMLLHLQIEECLGCDCGGFVRVIIRGEYPTFNVRTTFLSLAKNEFGKSYPYDHFGRGECAYESSIRSYNEMHDIDDW